MDIRLLILLLILPFVSVAQFTYDIKNPKTNYRNNCEECLSVLESKPPEVQMSVQKDGLGNVFFVVNNEAWLDALLRDPFHSLPFLIPISLKKERWGMDIYNLSS